MEKTGGEVWAAGVLGSPLLLKEHCPARSQGERRLTPTPLCTPVVEPQVVSLIGRQGGRGVRAPG